MNTIMKNDPDSKQMGYLKLFNPVTVRFAHKGEAHLMDFIFNATWLLRHNTEIKSKKEGEEPEIIKLENFVLSETSSSPQEASAAFEKIVEGNIAYLKEILASEICQDDEKNPMKIGVLLGMSVDEGTNRAYMRVFNPRLSCSTFKMKARSQRKMIKSVITECRFNKETIENLNSEKYPWDCWFNADLILSPFYMDSYKAPESSVEDSGSPFPFIPKYLSNDGDPDDNKKKSDDDLPF
jgi:hypothetical protein